MAPTKTAYGFRIKPARFEDWRGLSREGDKIVQRLGGTDVRTFAPMAAGPETATCFSTIDFEDGAHLGTFLDNVGRDLESQTLMDRMFGHTDSPAELLYTAFVSEFPLGFPRARGPVMDVWITRPKPGQIDDAVAMAVESAPIVAKTGAIGLHLYSVDTAGSESGTLVWTAEYENFESYGRNIDAMTDQEEMQKLGRRLMAPDSPFTLTQHSVMREVQHG